MSRALGRVGWSFLVGLISACTLAAAAQPEQSSAEDAPPVPAILVELEDAPAVSFYLDGLAAKASTESVAAAVRQHLDLLESRQRVFMDVAAAEVPEARPLYQMRRLINGVAYLVGEKDWERLRGLPGVKAVHAIPVVEPALHTTLPFLGIPEVWSMTPGGLTGKGVSIGIIDTGIDYLHVGLGGPGTRESYNANDATVLGDAPFPSARVAGGFDFAGEYYNPSDYRYAFPMPDPDPIDLSGHGTHVAGIAAGNGVLNVPTQHYGPYNSEIRLDRYLLAPGVAPEATLYALKVFGAGGGTTLVPEAVDWAMDPNDDGDWSDHLDIINLSLSGSYAKPPDVLTIACDAAARAGVLVAASAGNLGDVYFVAGTPGGASRVISVAASLDDDPAPGEGWLPLDPDIVAAFSSRGPIISDYRMILKPDICAPGMAITSANYLNSDREYLTLILSGTSMASPHVAGVLALLRQQHPGWTVEEIKALIMNTATTDVFLQPEADSPRCGLSRMGAGRVDPVSAASSRVIAFDAVHPWEVSLVFQTTEVLGSVRETRTFRIANKGDEVVSFRLSVDLVTPLSGVSVRTTPAETGPIAPGAHADVQVTMEAVANKMRHDRSADLLVDQIGQPRQWLSELSGFILLEPVGSGVPLHLPFYGTPRPVARMVQPLDFMDFTEHNRLDVILEGNHLPGGTARPFDIVPLVTPLELKCYVPRPANPYGFPDAAFVKYVGVTSDFEDVGSVVSKTTVSFGVAAYGTWSTPQQGLYVVLVDIDEDGVPDYTVYNGTFWEPFSGRSFEYSDVHLTVRGLWISLYQGLANGRALNYHAPNEFDTATFMNDVMVFTMSAHSLGLRALGDTDFDFWVETYFSERAFSLEVPDQISPVMHHDICRPGLVFPNGATAVPTFEDKNGGRIPVKLDVDSVARDKGLGLLLLHHHNDRDTRAEWVSIITAGDSDLDGIPDTTEGIEDFDGDGLPNLVDLDSDNDGIDDLIESAEDIDGDGFGNYVDLDSDNDSMPDALEGVLDSDRDGRLDAYDTDADGDGIPDIIELDGDADGDGVPNYLDLDSDGDGLPDWLENSGDIDGDGIPDFLDLDTDGDGLDDRDEVAIYHTDPRDPDSDGDGLGDFEEVHGATDPVVAQPPTAPQHVRATLGARSDRVRVLWGTVPGRVNYRVFRSLTGDLNDAVPVSGWLSMASHDDFTASPARYLPASGCGGEVREFVYYTYFVKARNSGGESSFSAGAQGCRGLP